MRLKRRRSDASPRPHRRARASALVAGAAVLSAVAVPTSASAAPNLTAWTTSGAVSAPSVERGGDVTITFTVKAASTNVALVDLEILGPTDQNVDQAIWDSQLFTAAQTRSYE